MTRRFYVNDVVQLRLDRKKIGNAPDYLRGVIGKVAGKAPASDYYVDFCIGREFDGHTIAVTETYVIPASALALMA